MTALALINDLMDHHINPKYRPQDLTVVKMEGTSMVPAYHPRDIVLVDTGYTIPSDGDYLIANALGDPHIKTLQVILATNPQMIRVISINQSYGSYEIEATKLHIFGRVVGKWTRK